jgi:hypothetical protein
MTGLRMITGDAMHAGHIRVTQPGQFSLERDTVAVTAIQAHPRFETRRSDQHGAVGGWELHSGIVVIAQQDCIGSASEHGSNHVD